MGLFDLTALVFTITAVLGYLNYRFLKLPMSIGLTVSALLLSMAILLLNVLAPVETVAQSILAQIDFDKALLQGFLSFLLFAGALHINLDDLKQQKFVVGFLASFGLLISTLLVGCGTYALFHLFGKPVPFIYCVLFGALISPTDPIAVLAILQTLKVPKSLETKIAGESLFNDGVGVVVFIVVLQIATGGEAVTVSSVLILFAKEALGGGLLGLVLGALTYYMLKNVDDYTLEILLTLALVTGGYSLAMTAHLSAPITVVVAGLLIGNHGRSFAMSEETREHLDTFWELIDKVLNASLFAIIGFEAILIDWVLQVVFAGILVAGVVLAARFVSVAIPVHFFKRRHPFSPGAIRILTWGGLRGGISIALALSLPTTAPRQTLIAMTYVVVVFSIFVQGLTIPRLLKRTALEL